MEKSLVTLDKGTTCSSWNYSSQRLATGSLDGTLTMFDSPHPSSSSFSSTSKFKVHHASGIVKVVWVPPQFGHAVACVCGDGTLSLWEETVEDAQPLEWKLCKCFQSDSAQPLDVQFGGSSSSLKMVTAYSDGSVKLYEVLDPLELKNWQLQVEIHNVIDSVSTTGKCAYLLLYRGTQEEEEARKQALFWLSIQTHYNLIPPRFGNLIKLIKDGSRLQSWLLLMRRVIRSMQLHGHQTLAGPMR